MCHLFMYLLPMLQRPPRAVALLVVTAHLQWAIPTSLSSCYFCLCHKILLAFPFRWSDYPDWLGCRFRGGAPVWAGQNRRTGRGCQCRRLQRDVIYLGWPIAPSLWAQMRGEGGSFGFLPMSTAVHRSTNKLLRSNSIFNHMCQCFNIFSNVSYLHRVKSEDSESESYTFSSMRILIRTFHWCSHIVIFLKYILLIL